MPAHLHSELDCRAKNTFPPSLAAGQVFLSKSFASMPAEGADLIYEPAVSTKVYHVVALVKDQNGNVADLFLEELGYRPRGAEDDCPGFRIFEEQVYKYNTTTRVDGAASGLMSFNNDVVGSGALPGDGVLCNKLNPTVSELVNALFEGKCPEGCDKGWLPNKQALLDFECRFDMPELSAFQPLCPVCYGWETVLGQLEIRRLIESGATVEQRQWLAFQEVVEERRWDLSYEALCSCEFCLMPLGGYIHPSDHDEAMQTFNTVMRQQMFNTVVPRPAARKVLDDLPRKTFGETTAKTRGQDQCPVCLDEFKDEKIVLELPCLHVMCPDECMGCFDLDHKCPVCRGHLTSAAESGDVLGDSQDVPAQPSLLEQFPFYQQPAIEWNLSHWSDEPPFYVQSHATVTLEGREWSVRGYWPNGDMILSRPFDEDEEMEEDDDDDDDDGCSMHGGPLTPWQFYDGIEERHEGLMREAGQGESESTEQAVVPATGWGDPQHGWGDSTDGWNDSGGACEVPAENREDLAIGWKDSGDTWEDAGVSYGEVNDAAGQLPSEDAAFDEGEEELTRSMENVNL